VRVTRNLSLPGAHLTPRLIGHVCGLAATQAPSPPLPPASPPPSPHQASAEGIEATLRAEGVASLAKAGCPLTQTCALSPSLAQATRVTIARFVRLVELVRDCDGHRGGAAFGGEGGGPGLWLMLRFLWAKANYYDITPESGLDIHGTAGAPLDRGG
jgi:hypothetical protein